MNINKYKETISYLTDFFMGFFFCPLIYFIVKTSTSLISEDGNIADGNALLYIAIITGLVLILKKNVYITIDKKIKNILIMIGGLLFFWLSYFYFN